MRIQVIDASSCFTCIVVFSRVKQQLGVWYLYFSRGQCDICSGRKSRRHIVSSLAHQNLCCKVFVMYRATQRYSWTKNFFTICCITTTTFTGFYCDFIRLWVHQLQISYWSPIFFKKKPDQPTLNLADNFFFFFFEKLLKIVINLLVGNSGVTIVDRTHADVTWWVGLLNFQTFVEAEKIDQ